MDGRRRVRRELRTIKLSRTEYQQAGEKQNDPHRDVRMWYTTNHSRTTASVAASAIII